jgi:hypothetical protein
MKALLLCLSTLMGNPSSMPPADASPPAHGGGVQKIGEEGSRRIQEAVEEKRARTPAQKKIDTQLLYALKQKRGETRGVPTEPVDIKLDAEGMTTVDITAKVSTRLVSKLKKLGAQVISKSERYHTIRARVALERLETLAGLEEVRYISAPAKAATHGGALKH